MSNAPYDSIVEVLDAAGRGLRVRFNRTADRVAHVVEFIVEGRSVPLLESIEGDSSQNWPVSPPLQQAHFEPRAGLGDVALLVGMAGRSHWSLSVEPEPQAASLLFDAACRVIGAPQQLGSRYRCLTGQWRLDAEGRATAELNKGEAVVLMEACEGTLEFAEPLRELVLRPARFDASSPTARWRYRLRIDA